MRIRVKIDVRKPLRRGKKISTGDGGHGDQNCEKLFTMVEDDGVSRWGAELPVDRKKGSRNKN
ncbi:hypothetical protein A2U01_0056480, partial [Trifolium medium]|nr:hypothetical protein [Trifolium medium]